MLKKAVLGVTLGAATMAMTTAPAQAQRYRHYGHGYHRGGNTAGAAILGGIVGLGVGAAIASDHRGRYYDNGYYAPPPPPPGYYGQGYYGGGYAYRPRCFMQNRWDPYYGQYVPVQVCR
ncbi:hypothetical protein EAH79_14940 [Sphingomonas koreensis]|nr:hypothetical protein EAH79_14940 [Sphingomonas koreensis]